MPTTSGTITNWTAPVSAGQPWSTTEANSRLVLPFSCTLSNLLIKTTTTITQGSYTFTVYKNGSPTAVTAILGTGITFVKDGTHTAIFSAGDTLSMAATNSVTSPTTLIDLSISFLLDASTSGETGIMGATSQNLEAGTTDYICPQASTAPSSFEASFSQVMPTPGNITAMYVDLNGSPGGTAAYQFSVMKNGVAQAITCTITGSATAANDTSHSVAFAAGDLISIQSIPTGTPTRRMARTGLKFIPTTNGESVQMAMGTSAADPGTTEYNGLCHRGQSWDATERKCSQVGQACVISKLFSNYNSAQGNLKSTVLTLMKAGSPTSITVTLSGTSQKTASDTTHSVTVSEGDYLDTQGTVSSGVTSDIYRNSYVTFISPTVAAVGSGLLLGGVG